MTASRRAVCCLARASIVGTCVLVTAPQIAIFCLARAGNVGTFAAVTAVGATIDRILLYTP